MLICYHKKVKKAERKGTWNSRRRNRRQERSRIMKKTALWIMMAMAATAMTAGCGNNNAEAQKETTTAKAQESGAAEASSEAEGEAEALEAGTEAGAGGTLIVGFDQEFPPMGFIGEDGEYTGFDLELAQEVAKRLGLSYQPQPIAWDAKDMELESGNIDCIWNGFTMTGREEDYTWSDPYMENSQVFVVRADSGITSAEDLAGKIVEVQIDSSGQKALEADPELSGSFGQLITTPDYNTAFMDLEQGAVDAICMDIIVAGYQIAERDADMVILDEALAKEEYGIGFKKGNTELRDQVNDTLIEMAEDGTLAEISTKWFSEDITTIGK